MDWITAETHFNEVMRQYEALYGMPGVNVSFALALVFRPLKARFEGGERTQQLYDEMMSVK